MGFYQNPIGPVDPFDPYRVEGASEKQNKELPPPDDKPPKNKKGIVAELLHILKKAVDYFLQEHTEIKTATTGIRSQLLLLKKYFIILQNEDRSQDVNFLNELSVVWNRIQEESLNLEEREALPFKLLTKKILSYPENQLHTFGYYLKEYAGQKWVPFPYMELIQKIHYEHENIPNGSALSEWVHLIDEIIKLLNDK
jgi:hypothetical protein